MNVFDHLSADVTVNGNIPPIPDEAKVVQAMLK